MGHRDRGGGGHDGLPIACVRATARSGSRPITKRRLRSTPPGADRRVCGWYHGRALRRLDSRRTLGYEWTGTTRADVQFFYPRAPLSSGARAPYLVDPRIAQAMIDSSGAKEAATYRRWAQIATHSQLDAKPRTARARWPLLLLAGGCCGMGTRAGYTAIAEELASQGFVVAAIDFPYENSVTALTSGTLAFSRPDPDDADDFAVSGARAERWAIDASFIVDAMARAAKSRDTAAAVTKFAVNRSTAPPIWRGADVLRRSTTVSAP